MRGGCQTRRVFGVEQPSRSSDTMFTGSSRSSQTVRLRSFAREVSKEDLVTWYDQQKHRSDPARQEHLVLLTPTTKPQTEPQTKTPKPKINPGP